MQEAYKADKAGFEDLTESALLTIVQMEKMDMSELELFRAVAGWARRQCLKRNVEMTGTNMRQVIVYNFKLLILRKSLPPFQLVRGSSLKASLWPF